MYKLVLVRHGQSQWNEKNWFTGWVDVDLTPKGEAEAAEAGKLLKDFNDIIEDPFEIWMNSNDMEVI